MLMVMPAMLIAASCAAADLPPKTVIEPAVTRQVPGWVRDNTRPSHLPPPDWKEIEAHLKAGVTSLCTNMDSRWSKVGPAAYLYKPEVVKEADETMRRFVQMTRAAGAKVIFYIGPVHVASWNREFREAHPDWLMIHADGRQGDLCNWRSGYGKWLTEQLAYVVRTYKIDGFWFDGYSGWQYSYDDTSKRLFGEHSGGKEIPARLSPDDPVSQEYLRWYWKGYIDFADSLRAAIRKENPEAVIFANYSACREWYQPGNFTVEYPACYANAVDLPSIEQYWDTPGDALNQQFIAAFTEGVSRGRGATVWAQPRAHGTEGLAPEVEFRLRYLLGATWGVYTEFVEPTGRKDYLDMWVGDMKSREEWMRRSEPLPWIGVVASEQTKMYYGRLSPLTNYFSHTLGAFKALVESHRPVRVLTEYDLEEGNLGGVKVLVLPNVACMSDRAAEVVRRFVNDGGGLVATYETSLFDQAGKKRQDFALGDLFQASYLGTHPVLTRDEALRLYAASGHSITDSRVIERSQWTSSPPEHFSYGQMAMVSSAVKTGIRPNGQSVVVFREKGDPADTFPATVVSTAGKGRVVYFPAAVDKALFFYPEPYQRELLRNACDWAAGAPPPVEVRGPYMLATTFRVQPEKRRLVVHLLNDASSWGRHSIYQKVAPGTREFEDPGHPQSPELRGTWPVREEVIPIHDIKVICRQPGVTKATLQPGGAKLTPRRVDGGVEVTVPKVELHSMVVFE